MLEPTGQCKPPAAQQKLRTFNQDPAESSWSQSSDKGLRASEVHWVTRSLWAGRQWQKSFYCKGRKYQLEWAEVKCFPCLNRSNSRLTSLKKGGLLSQFSSQKFRFLRICDYFGLPQQLSEEKAFYFLVLFLHRRTGKTTVYWNKRRDYKSLPQTKGAVWRSFYSTKVHNNSFPVKPRWILWTANMGCTQEMSSPTAMWKPFLQWSKVKRVGLCHVLCSGQRYAAVLGKRVPSGCLLCLVLYRSYGPSTVLNEVGLVGISAERLRICSDILSTSCPGFKNADFSKEMSAGAVEWGCSKQACAFMFGEMGLSYLHSLHVTVLQRELKPVLLCRS